MLHSTYTPCPSREPVSIWNAGVLYAQYKAQAERFQRLLMHAEAKAKVYKEINEPRVPLPEDSFEAFIFETNLSRLQSRVTELQCELAIVNREMKDIEREFAQYELFNKCKE
jgi:hypothetical protein